MQFRRDVILAKDIFCFHGLECGHSNQRPAVFILWMLSARLTLSASNKGIELDGIGFCNEAICLRFFIAMAEVTHPGKRKPTNPGL